LNLGSGATILDGYVNVDKKKLIGVDIVHDLEQFPWPFKTESVDFILASHIFCHLERKNFIKVMDECHRILKENAQMIVTCPYGNGNLFAQDPTHTNPITENTWRYFAPEDKTNLYSYYEPKPWKIINCVFDINGNMETALERYDK
jgi:SAM-dependent methyltransferase